MIAKACACVHMYACVRAHSVRAWVGIVGCPSTLNDMTVRINVLGSFSDILLRCAAIK